MNMVTRILIEEQAPESSNSNIMWGDKHGPDLVLVIFDTAVIDRINNERYAGTDMEEFRLKKPPGKYALSFDAGWTDSSIFGQVMLTHDEYRDKAVWFDRFSDLPFAVTALRERYPDIHIPEQVSFVIDWPLNEGNRNPGATIVITAKRAE